MCRLTERYKIIKETPSACCLGGIGEAKSLLQSLWTCETTICPPPPNHKSCSIYISPQLRCLHASHDKDKVPSMHFHIMLTFSGRQTIG